MGGSTRDWLYYATATITTPPTFGMSWKWFDFREGKRHETPAGVVAERRWEAEAEKHPEWGYQSGRTKKRGISLKEPSRLMGLRQASASPGLRIPK